jgi:stalled ribosome rescue protein Dom34
MNVSAESCTENQDKHFVLNNVSFSENRGVYEIMWKNMVQPEWSQMTVKYDASALHDG